MRNWAMIGLLLAAGGCSKQAEKAPAPQAGASASASALASAAPVGGATAQAVSSGQGRSVAISNKLMDFDYAYPAAAAAIPALRSWLDADLEKHKASTAAGTREELEMHRKDPSLPAHTYAHSTTWQVVTETPGWLSLSANRWEYTGGAHGNPWFDELLWDKKANRQRSSLDLFTSKAALSTAIRQPFCAEIDKQRTKKREEPVVRDKTGLFDDCIDPVESTVILGSTDRQHFTRVGVLVGPYAAGPYVEGEYEVTLPVTPAVIGAVRPEYRSLFAAGR